jgi:hypothetical protein
MTSALCAVKSLDHAMLGNKLEVAVVPLKDDDIIIRVFRSAVPVWGILSSRPYDSREQRD